MADKVTSKNKDGATAPLIAELVACGALRTDKDYSLKSKRESPYFLNIGDVNTGPSTAALAEAYASTIASVIGSHKKEWENLVLYGIPEKGVALAPTVSVALAQNYGIKAGWFFTRKTEKTYGEATNLPKADLAKSMIVGRMPTADSKIVLLDDVLTTADAKYAAIKDLNTLLEKPKIIALFVAADRQEVGIDGKEAAEEFSKSTGIPVYASLSATEIRRNLALKADYDQKGVERMATYLQVYGTRKAHNALAEDKLIKEGRIVTEDRSVIPALDITDIKQYEAIVKGVAGVEGIGALKVGFSLALTYGLPQLVASARNYTQMPIIYDHQKGATDVPDTGNTFMRVVKKAGVDAVILFPQSGSETERAWIYRALDNDLKVIVGGVMTHPAYLVSEGGFIDDKAAYEIYRIAARAGVSNFVVPGTKPDIIKAIKEVVEAEGISPTWYVPGMVTQGGDFAKVKAALGSNWNAIVGRAITGVKDENYTLASEGQVKLLLRQS